MSEVRDDGSTTKTLSAAARRSFFRRKHKHKRSGSKDGKDLLALDTFSSDSIPLLEGEWACQQGLAQDAGLGAAVQGCLVVLAESPIHGTWLPPLRCPPRLSGSPSHRLDKSGSREDGAGQGCGSFCLTSHLTPCMAGVGFVLPASGPWLPLGRQEGDGGVGRWEPLLFSAPHLVWFHSLLVAKGSSSLQAPALLPFSRVH